MRYVVAMLLAPLLPASGPAMAQDAIALSPTQVGEVFCLSRLGNDLGPIEGLLTPELAAAIAEAERKNVAWEKANPGDKPPLGDGIPWAAWPDHAPGCAAGEPSYMMDEASIAIAYGFPDAPEADYRDRLELKLVPGETGKVWRIDNLSYATEGDLRRALVTAFVGN